MEGVLAHLGRRPLVGGALLFALGVWFAQPQASGGKVYLACAAALAAFAAASGRALPGIAALASLAAFAIAGAGAAALRQRVVSPVFDERPVLLEGAVAALPRTVKGRTHFPLAVDATKGPGGWNPARFEARLSAQPIDLLPGDRVRLRADLRPPSPAQNPGAPDLAARAGAEGIAAVGAVVEQQIAVVGHPALFQPELARYRARYRDLAADATGDAQAAALIRSLAIGDRADVSDSVSEEFNASGLAHILSVSGLHIAVVAAGLYRALRWLLTRLERIALAFDARAAASLLAIPATWLYALVTGGEVPAVRSALMASALFLARAIGRDGDAPSALGAALLAVLCWDPAALQSISFQLSFAAVAGLMLLTAPLRDLIPIRRPDLGRDPRWRSLLELGLSGALGSLAASLATGPLVAGAFQRASTVAVLANLFALPVASALTALAAASAVALPVARELAAAILCLADPFARLLLAISRFFGELPYASLRVPALSPLALAAWYAALAALSLAKARPRAARRTFAASAAILFLLALRYRIAPLVRGGLTVTFLAVGQGDSALVQLPGGGALLIDAGGDPAGRFDTGERIVVPALTELGALSLDAAVLSHPHPDHGGGLGAVLRRLEVRELWLARAESVGRRPLLERSPGAGARAESVGRRSLLERSPGAGARAESIGRRPLLERSPGAGARAAETGALVDGLRAAARERKTAVRELEKGDRLDIGEVRIEVLHPGPDAGGASANDASLVLKVTLGEVSFLFPGDIEAEGEGALLAGEGLASSVVKAPHHGSRTSSSSSFVERARPGHVVFCVGLRNRFGFPQPEVVERYRAQGCALHRTDRDGAIRFWTDGRALEVEHFTRQVASPVSDP